MKKISSFATILAVAFLLGFNVSSAQMSGVIWEVLREADSKVNYANLVILGDNFKSGDELEKNFPVHAKAILDTLDEQARHGKWEEYWKKVRVVLAKTPSDTGKFFSSYSPGGVIITLTEGGYQKVAQVLSSVPGGYDVQKDMAILVSNIPENLGTFAQFGLGYKLAMTSVFKRPGPDNYSYRYIASHEWGHNWLGDNYPWSAAAYDAHFQEERFNIMKVPPEKVGGLRKEDIKWSHLINSGVKIPTDRTQETHDKAVGFYKLRENESNEKYFIGFTTGIMNGGLDWRPRFNPVDQEGIRLGLRQRFEMLAADFNEDGVVEFADFFLFAEGFGKQKGEAGFNPRYDLDKSGEVSFDDFFLFADSFGKKKGPRNPVPVVLASKPIVIAPVNVCGGQHEVGINSSPQDHQHESGQKSDDIRLNQNFPNPFN